MSATAAAMTTQQRAPRSDQRTPLVATTVGRLVLGLAGLTTAAVLLELIPRLGLVDDRYLPPTSAIFTALAGLVADGTFWVAIGQTIRTWAIGLLVAMIAGVALGLLIGSSRWVTRFTSSTVEFLRPIPSVALIPLAILVYGTGMQATLLLVVYASFWQVLLQVLYGVQDIDPVARDTARSFGLGRLARARVVTWPTALPYVVTAFRLAASVALILTLTGELIIGTPGLGQRVALAEQSGAVDRMYALILVTGLLGVTVNLVARALERRVLRWHPSIRREVAA